MNKEIYLSVIIPVYNEEKTIKKTLLDVNDFFASQEYNSEIILIDDDSKDDSYNISRNLRSIVKNLSVLKNSKNCGKGYSVKKGMLIANGKFRLFIDADNSTNIRQINNFIPFLENGCDIVIGSRKLKGSEIKKHQPLHREAIGVIGNILIRLLAVSEITDTQCGFKCFSEKFVSDVFTKTTISRWGFDIEILALAKKFGYEIKAVPIVWEDKGKSKVSFEGYIFTLKELLQIKINLLRKKYDY